MTENNLDAVDAVNWEYLCKIREKFDPPKSKQEIFENFAWELTSIPRKEHQTLFLAWWLQNATYLQSAETNEEVIATVASIFNSDLNKLREFAKQQGIRLKRFKRI